MAAPVSIDLDKLLDSDDDADEVCATSQLEMSMKMERRGFRIVYDGAHARPAGANSTCCRPQQLCQFICCTPQSDCSTERSSEQSFTRRQVPFALGIPCHLKWSCVSSCGKLIWLAQVPLSQRNSRHKHLHSRSSSNGHSLCSSLLYRSSSTRRSSNRWVHAPP
jgi:hypothetical protein